MSLGARKSFHFCPSMISVTLPSLRFTGIKYSDVPPIRPAIFVSTMYASKSGSNDSGSVHGGSGSLSGSDGAGTKASSGPAATPNLMERHGA